MTNHRISPLSLLLFFLLILACKSAGKKDTPTISIKDKPTTEMPIPPLPTPGDYAADWKIVDSLEGQGLYKSALEKTEAIQAKAANDKNSQQVIKALLYRGKYTTQLEEDGFVKAVQLFESEEKKARQPEKAVLQSILGQLYATYLSNQGWRINERTPIPDGEGGDILTWSAAQIERRAIELYASSVVRHPIVLETPVESFRDILSRGQNDTIAGQPLRPTLYDLLAHRALSHFANERSYLTEPAYKFELNQEAAFAPLAQFVKTNFETKDSTSGKWLATMLFQDLLRRPHRTIDTPGQPRQEIHHTAAVVSDDLLRLQFAFNNSVREDKASFYQNALEALLKQYAEHPVRGEIAYQLAQYLYTSGIGDPAQRGQDARKAVALCEEAIRRHPNTFGAQQCEALLKDIRAKSLSITVENVYLPEKPGLVRVRFRNVNKVFVKVVKANFDPNFLEDVQYDALIEKLNSLPQVQRRDWDIQDPGDYQAHTTEIALSSLPLGTYYLLASENAGFDQKKGSVSYAPIVVSNLAPVSYREPAQSHFIVAHRQTGTPLAGVKLEFFPSDYRNPSSRTALQTIVTNQNGSAKADWGENNHVAVRATLANDTLWIGHFYHYRDHYRENENWLQARFFTDRSIYRPGQTVYFKGILFKQVSPGSERQKQPQIVPNQSVTVKFFDTNGQEKSSLQLRSNEFGTFNGAFTAPASGLTGQMRIECEGANGGAAYFNVEEYKRPKFEVTFEPVKEAFRLGENVTMRGAAKAFAGSNVDGAQVRYRVVRQARFPFWDWGWKRGIYPPWRTDAMEITNGTTTTDAEGKFEVKFEAIPDRYIPKKDRPMFDYTVYADVTDITGETRSNQQYLTAGYIAMQVDWGLGSEAELSALDSISLETKNLAGQPQPASGEITLQRLTEPKQFFIARYWEQPDIATIQKDEWKRLFPDYAWQDEDNPDKWEREDYIIPVAFNTASAKTVDLNGGNIQPGYYAVKLTTKDPFGEVVEIQKIVRVWDKKNRATQFEKPSFAIEKSSLEPGETAKIWLGGKPENLNIFFAREQDGSLPNPRWLAVNGATHIEIPVTENDRGGISAHWFVIKNNRSYGGQSLSISVPWSNKDLQISYETFRDKLAPGQKEEWRIKISGPKKEKVAAEMVAAMYDASLDQFLPHSWEMVGFPSRYARVHFNASQTFGSHSGNIRHDQEEGVQYPVRHFQELNWFDFPLWGGRYFGKAMMRVAADMEMAAMAPAPAGGAPGAGEELLMQKADVGSETKEGSDTPAPAIDEWTDGGQNQKPATPPAPLRRNLNETVFFFPELRTDKDGNVVLKFTMNEALTRWKLLTYAHTKDLQQAVSVKEVVTQKELMVIANPPRFLRAGDAFEFSAKVSNLSQETLNGTATLSLLDANTLQPLAAAFGMGGDAHSANFSVAPGQSAPLFWKIKVPVDYSGAVTWQISADSKKFRDGEESTIPVVTNRMLVTETLPITVRGNQTKSFVFENLKSGLASSNNSSLITHHYTIEFTSNPAWYAVQSLPYLMEFPHECSEQIFSRFYANTLASSVVEKMPNIKRVYERWKGTDALKSNLSKNQELKYALLEETPWVLDAQNEEQQKQNIALLFDMNRMADERERAVNTLAERQLPNGGWAWFPGGQDSWHITQHIVSGFGHLKQLGAFDTEKDPQAAQMLDRALGYCDMKLAEQYRELEKRVQQGKAKWDDDHLDGMVIQYLYTRSFFSSITGTSQTGREDINDPQQTGAKPGREISYYLSQAEKHWLNKGLYQEGMLALALHRNGRAEAAQRIVASLRERASVKEELGMFWPVDWGFYWYQLPVETQALMVEVFGEVAGDKKAVEELRIWLLKNKQTNRWESTKATAEAVYALLLFGDPKGSGLQNTKPVQVSLGGKTLKPAEYEAGTGYFKQNWSGAEVKNSWSNIKVENPNSNIVWGAAYWQYFEDLDKIKDFQKTPLIIVKQLFTEENSPTGPVLKPVAEGATLKRGDKVKVRIEIRVDRAMEYVHLKDMRAAGFEPVNVLSGYRWQGGLGYYESTKDLATHFFIDYLPRGTFVFEYPLVVNHRGDMSNGVTTMQCMYAPEFTSHSKGVRVKVE